MPTLFSDLQERESCFSALYDFVNVNVIGGHPSHTVTLLNSGAKNPTRDMTAMKWSYARGCQLCSSVSIAGGKW